MVSMTDGLDSTGRCVNCGRPVTRTSGCDCARPDRRMGEYGEQVRCGGCGTWSLLSRARGVMHNETWWCEPCTIARIDRLMDRCTAAESRAGQRVALVREVEQILGVADGSAGDEQLSRGVESLRKLRDDMMMWWRRALEAEGQAEDARDDATDLRRVVAAGAPMDWVDSGDMDAAIAWEAEAAPIVHGPRLRPPMTDGRVGNEVGKYEDPADEPGKGQT